MLIALQGCSSWYIPGASVNLLVVGDVQPNKSLLSAVYGYNTSLLSAVYIYNTRLVAVVVVRCWRWRSQLSSQKQLAAKMRRSVAPLLDTVVLMGHVKAILTCVLSNIFISRRTVGLAITMIISDLTADSECSLGQFHLLMVGTGPFLSHYRRRHRCHHRLWWWALQQVAAISLGEDLSHGQPPWCRDREDLSR